MQRKVSVNRFVSYQKFLYRIAYGHLQNRMDVEDAVQTTFVRAWMYCERLENEDAIFTWVTRR